MGTMSCSQFSALQSLIVRPINVASSISSGGPLASGEKTPCSGGEDDCSGRSVSLAAGGNNRSAVGNDERSGVDD